MKGFVFVLLSLVFASGSLAQSYWSISLPLLNFQRVASVLNTNEFGINYSSINSYKIFSLQQLISNRWGWQFNIRSCTGEMNYGGLSSIEGLQDMSFDGYETRVRGNFERNVQSISRVLSYNVSNTDYYFDFELMVYRGFSLIKNDRTFRNLEWIIGGGSSIFLPVSGQTPSNKISVLKRDEKHHLYGVNYSFRKFPLSLDFITGFEIYAGKNFHLSTRLNATYLVYNKQSVSIKRLSGVAETKTYSANENFSNSLLLGGQFSVKYHLNLNQEETGKHFLEGFRKLIFRY